MKTKHHITVGKAASGSRCRTISFGRNIQAIICYPKNSRRTKKRAKRGSGKGKVVSLRFDPKKYSLSQAKSWAKQHGYSVKRTAKATAARKNPTKKKAPRKKKALRKKIKSHLKRLWNAKEATRKKSRASYQRFAPWKKRLVDKAVKNGMSLGRAVAFYRHMRKP